jgi:hypothetical protein
MAIAGALEIQLFANIARLQSDMTQAKGVVGAAMSEMSSMVGKVQSAFSALGVGLSAGYFVSLVKGSIDAINHLDELTKSTGLTIDELSGLKLAARESGADFDGLAKGVDRMTVAMGKSPEKFRALGITAKDSSGALGQLSDIFNSLTDVQQRNALAQATFGRSWAELAPILSMGSAKIEETMMRGAALADVTEEMTKQAHLFKIQMAELEATLDSGKMKLANDLLPALNSITAAMKQAAIESGFLKAVLVGIGGIMAEWVGLNKTAADRGPAYLKSLQDEFESLTEMKAAGAELLAGEQRRLALLPDLIAKTKELVDVQNKVSAGPGAAFAGGKAGASDPGAAARTAAFLKTGIEAATAASDSLIASLQKELIKVNELSGSSSKYQQVLVDIAKLKKEGKPVDDMRAKQIAKEIDDTINLRIQTEAYNKVLDELDAVRQKEIDDARQIIESLDDQNKRTEFENSLIGKTVEEQKLANIEFERNLALRGKSIPIAIDEINKAYDLKKALAAQGDEIRTQTKFWDDAATAAGNFFGDLIVNGKSAFDNLRAQLKSFLQELLALFAKRWILQMVGSLVGGTSGAAIAAAGGSSGSGSLAGTALSAGSSYLGNTALGTTLGGWAGGGSTALGSWLGASGTGATGAFSGATVTGSTGIGGSGALATIGWIVAVVAGMYANNSMYTAGWRRPTDGSSTNPLTAVQQGGPTMGASYSADAIFRSLGFSDRMASLFSGSSMNTRLFGHQMTHADAAGITGTTTGSGGFDAMGYQDFSQRGGVFSSDRRWTETSALTADQTKPFRDAIATIHQQMLNLGAALGVDAATLLRNYTHAFHLQLTSSSSQQEIDDAIAGFFQTVFVDQANILLGAATGRIHDYITQFQGSTEDLVTAIGQVAIIFGVAGRSPLADAMEVITAEGDQFNTALRANAAGLHTVMDAYDGTLESTTNLANATITYYNAQIQLIAAITRTKQAIDDMFGATFHNIQMAGMDRQGQYNFYQHDADVARALALTSTDPDTIRTLSQRINDDIASAFNLLTPDQQRAQSADFLTRGQATQAAIDQHMIDIRQNVVDATVTMTAAVRDLIGSLTTTAATNATAANTNLAAATTPTTVHVEVTVDDNRANASVVNSGG